MVHWLVQATGAHPALAQGEPPPGLLSPAELGVFGALRTPKRRADWLLGRWTAKHLVHAACPTLAPSLAGLAISADDHGAPRMASVLGAEWWALSIAHAGGWAAAAIDPNAPAASIGIDLEPIASRSPELVADFYVPAEQDLVAAAPASQRALVATAIWCGKEAALKALRLGLTVDARAVSVRLAPAQPAPTGWARLHLSFNQGLLGSPLPAALAGWWRTWSESIVLALCADASEQPAPEPQPLVEIA